jgi:LysM repeat protein
MSTTIDRMKQAMEKRKALEASMIEENNIQSAKQPVLPNKIVLQIFLMQIMWAIILGGIIYVYINQSTKDSLNTIVAKLDHLENRFDPLKEQLSKVEESIKTANGTPSQGVFFNASLTAKASPKPKKISAPIETVKQSIQQGSASPASNTLPSEPHKEIGQPGQQYHKVERGETLYKISKRYGIAVEEICRLNNFKQGQTIQPGQKLLVSSARY